MRVQMNTTITEVSLGIPGAGGGGETKGRAAICPAVLPLDVDPGTPYLSYLYSRVYCCSLHYSKEVELT